MYYCIFIYVFFSSLSPILFSFFRTLFLPLSLSLPLPLSSLSLSLSLSFFPSFSQSLHDFLSLSLPLSLSLCLFVCFLHHSFSPLKYLYYNDVSWFILFPHLSAVVEESRSAKEKEKEQDKERKSAGKRRSGERKYSHKKSFSSILWTWNKNCFIVFSSLSTNFIFLVFVINFYSFFFHYFDP